MKKPLDIFLEVPCLTEKSSQFNGLALQKKWFKTADKRYIGQYLQKFIDYNNKCFKFIGAFPYIVGTDQNSSIYFKTTQYIGSIPLRSPDTGKQIGDFVVTPRYFGNNRYEDYIDLLTLLKSEINPEIFNSIPLASGKNFVPPMYLEAVRFINLLENLVKSSWIKFKRIEKLTPEPTGQINWNKYIENEYKVERKLQFPSGKNILNEYHREYSQIRYVFDLCKQELSSSNTPFKIKLKMKTRLSFLEEKLYFIKPIPTNNIQIKFSDAPIVKTCKENANKILNYKFQDSTAWRVDFADVFEKFIQYIFQLSASETGGQVISNYKFQGYNNNSSWSLKYLEPDAIYKKNELFIMIDAKYKSHIFNKYNTSDYLKEEHRNDLHQILCYSSFSKSKVKHSFLCYPSSKIESNIVKYVNGINQTTNFINILGLPLKTDIIIHAKDHITNELFNIEKKLIKYNETPSAIFI